MKVWHWTVIAAVVVALGYQMSERHMTGVHSQSSVIQQVVVVPVKRTEFKTSWDTVGSVVAKSTMDMKPELDGVVGQLRFKDGDWVTAGQTLIVLDSAPYQSKMTELKATLGRDTGLVAKAEEDVDHATTRLQQQLITHADMTRVQTALQTAQTLMQQDQANLAQAERNLANLGIKAPISGRIGPRLVSSGTPVRAATTVLASISSLDPIVVQFSVPEKYVAHIQTDLKQHAMDVTAEFNNDARVDQRHGVVGSITDAALDKQGNLMLQADVANPQHDWQPGQFVKVRLNQETLSNVLVVPSIALRKGPQGQQLFLVENNHVRRVNVQEIANNNGYSAISGPVQPDALVVVDGGHHIADNMPVTVVQRDTVNGSPASLSSSVSGATTSASQTGSSNAASIR
jgi:multidrug efflux system membrane fusion protein